MNVYETENPTPMVGISNPLFTEYGVAVFVKRDDLNHPIIQGNKWHKLKGNLKHAQQTNKDCLITFGGAYSNHIAATAAAAKQAGLPSIGYIRGDELATHPEKWSHTLINAANNGMQLRFISRQAYRQKESETFLKNLTTEFPNAYILPEGGSNVLAVEGFASLINDIEQQCPDWTHLYTAVGTGGTLAGLIKHAKYRPNRTIQGVAVLKQADYLLPHISEWSKTETQTVNWSLLTDYHDGGYGQLSSELKAFKTTFETQYQIPLDPVYTTKMMYAFYQELKQGHLPKGSKVVLLHTGGLQGNEPKNQG
ncbi:MAG: pyridoxal-phosphate dependent enzyme [Thiotrichales bacterium]|nr:pyridoxal-phosphate dependent enzyme [Thiotrichales bacterium]